MQPLLREELHARAKILETRERISYGEALTRALAEKFSKYDDRTAADSAWVLGLPPEAARANLDRQLQKIAGRPTVTPAELIDVLRWHGIFQAVSSFELVLDEAIVVDDARRFVIDRGVLIKTRDGATISADVVRPKRLAGPQPAVLHFTMDLSLAINLRDAKDAAVRGYIGVFASARGKYRSTDKIVPWETEVRDTHDVIDWISRQPWSNGKVGMFGHSYGGFAQWAAAKNLHPALKTIVPSGASSPGNGMPMQNNVFQNAQYSWPLQFTNDRCGGDPSLRDRGRWLSLLAKWFESGRPLRDIDAIDGTPNEVLQRQMRDPSYDAYWQAMQPYEKEFGAIDIPVLTLTGFYDDAGTSAVNYLVEHHRYNQNAEHYLVIGPYPSNGDIFSSWIDPMVNGYTFDPVAQIDMVALVYQWFDYVLRGAQKPALLEDRINYQVMGRIPGNTRPPSQRWRTERCGCISRISESAIATISRRGAPPPTVSWNRRLTSPSARPGSAFIRTRPGPTLLTHRRALPTSAHPSMRRWR